MECIDLALELGEPGFNLVLHSILSDSECERAVFASECCEHNPEIWGCAESLAQTGIRLDLVSHEEFKQQCSVARAVIRTGECTPYANVILHSGVIF
ncbi:D-ribose pyranase [Chromobacterium vaccinii]|nr:D-ribose pyranase [Chromobacterium vaccinii]SUX54070.1 D-ribose pyranase [Chromobacterium vaccinii]